MLDILIKNARIITMDDATPVIDSGVIGVKNGKIQFVLPSETFRDFTSQAECSLYTDVKRVIDAKQNIVMPGLINTHAHAAMCIMRGYADDYALNEWLHNKIFPVEARLNEQAIRAGVRLAAAEMLASGTTSFSDMYFCEPAAAEVVAETGIRASLANPVMALSDDYEFEKDRAVIETRSLIKNFHHAENDRIRADAAIHAEYTSSPEIWRKVSDIAKENDIILQIHVSETQKEHEECIRRYGMTPVAVLNKNGVFDNKTIAAHCVWVTEDDMDILAEKGVSVSHNPVSNLKLASGIANIRAMLKHGINITLGTDGCASNNSHDLFEELKLCPLLAKGTGFDPSAVPAYEALKAATVNGARAQGRSGQTGMLKEGYEADLIMIDTNKPKLQPVYDPIGSVVYSADGNDVILTMVQGRILYENGEWTTIDVEKAIKEVYKTAVPLVLNRLK